MNTNHIGTNFDDFLKEEGIVIKREIVNKTDKTIFTIILISIVYTFVLGIIAIKQYFEIQMLQDNNNNYQTVIADYKKEHESKEYKAFVKCQHQGIFLAECIEWELGVNDK